MSHVLIIIFPHIQRHAFSHFKWTRKYYEQKRDKWYLPLNYNFNNQLMLINMSKYFDVISSRCALCFNARCINYTKIEASSLMMKQSKAKFKIKFRIDLPSSLSIFIIRRWYAEWQKKVSILINSIKILASFITKENCVWVRIHLLPPIN